MSNQSQNPGTPSHQNQPGGGGSQTQHNPKPDRTAQPGQEHRPDKDRPNTDPNRPGGQPGGGQERGGSRSS
jgi:hypothetical protein